MITQKDAFLSQFDEGLRVSIIEFGKRISNCSNNSDVIIFMARKSVCFAESLRLIKLTSYQCIVTSNRILDLDIEWLRDKKIAIFDDGLITGTSIYKTFNKLKSIGCDVKVFVLCINLNYWSKDLVDPEKPYLELTDNKTASLCASIVDAISVIPYPYSTDYPIFTGIKIPANKFDAMISTSEWDVVDVSSTLQQKYRIFAKVFEPYDNVKNEIKEALGSHVVDKSLIKLRIYGRPINKDNTMYWCNIHPIIAFEPLNKKDINNIYYTIKLKSKVNKKVWDKWFVSDDAEENNDRYKAKLLLIQYYASLKIAEIWKKEVERLTGEPFKIKLDEQSLSFLFPFPILEDIKKLGKENIKVFQYVNNNDKLNPPNKIKPPLHDKYNGYDGWSIESRFTEPFLYLYDTYEIPARNLALKHGIRIFTDNLLKKQYDSLVNRLEVGYSLNQIRGWLNHLEQKNMPLTKATSSFLDESIDRGIVVPITCVINDMVFRGYRHGEDVKFGEGDKKLIAHMLKSFYDSSGMEKLSGKEIEKCTVLTIKKMVEKGYLVQAPKHNIGRPGTIGIRFSLHGAVVEEGNDKLYSYGSGCSIRTILSDAKYIRISSSSVKQSDNTEYEVLFDGKDESGIKEGGVEEAKIFGELIGNLRGNARKRNTNAKLTMSDLTLLATIQSSKDLAAALSAEINWANSVFRRLYRSYENFVFDQTSEKNAERFFSDMRNVDKDHLFASISSGTWKYINYKNGEPWKTVERVYKALLEEKIPYTPNIWKQYWKDALIQGKNSVPDSIKLIIEKEAEWLFHMRAFHAMLEICFLLHGKKYVKDYENKLAGLLKEIEAFVKHSKELGCKVDFKEIPLFAKIKDNTIKLNELRKYALEGMHKKIQEANDILKYIDSTVSPFGEIETILEYGYIALIHFNGKSSEHESYEKKIVDIIYKEFNDYRKANNLSADTVAIIPKEVHHRPNCIMVAGYSHNIINFIVNCIIRIKLNHIKQLDFNIYVMADLPWISQIRRNKGANQYYGNMVWSNLEGIQKQCSNLHNNNITFITQSQTSISAVLNDYTNKNIARYYDMTHGDVISIEETYTTFTREVYALKAPVIESLSDRKADIGIITIVSDEMRAARDMLKQYPCFCADRKGIDYDFEFDVGCLPAKSNQMHTVACVQALEQGPTAVMPAYQALCDEYNPKLVILLGIGGNIDEKLKVCDVVVGSMIINYLSISHFQLAT
jgi:hypothetical protein